jgi:hypothetical protein
MNCNVEIYDSGDNISIFDIIAVRDRRAENMDQMRRSDRKMSDEKALQVLKESVYGILSTIGEDGYPYGVPVSYALSGQTLYFHCATEGKKLRNLAWQEKVSFAVVGQNEVLSKQFSMSFESVIVFGKSAELTDQTEKVAALMLLVNKYSPEYVTEGEAYARKAVGKTRIFKIDIEHICGKERR